MRNLHRNLIFAVLAFTLVISTTTGCNSDNSSNTASQEQLAGNISSQVTSSLRNANGGLSAMTSSNLGIHVTGSGTVAVEPDIGVLSIAIETTNRSLSISSIRNAKSTDLILKTLKANDIDEEDIKTKQYSTQPVYKYTQESGQKLQGYKVTNALQITLRSIGRSIGPVIDELVNAAGDDIRINRIDFQKEDTSEAVKQARILAAKNAIEIAELYAKELGVMRGELLYVVDQNSSHYPEKSPLVMAEAGLMARSAPTTIMPGDYEVTATIRVVFAID